MERRESIAPSPDPLSAITAPAIAGEELKVAPGESSWPRLRELVASVVEATVAVGIRTGLPSSTFQVHHLVPLMEERKRIRGRLVYRHISPPPRRCSSPLVRGEQREDERGGKGGTAPCTTAKNEGGGI